MEVFPLSDLAMEAVGELVSGLARNIVSGRNPDHAVSYLEEMIRVQVPSVIADQITEKLLSCILGLFYEFIQTSHMFQITSNSCVEHCSSACRSFLSVARATVHPCTTHIHYNGDYRSAYSSSYIRKFMKKYLHHFLLKVKNLRVLKLRAVEFDAHLIESSALSLHNLQVLEYNFCTDNILCTLSSMCTRLKVLDVRGSSGVTNVSVGHILKFKDLWSLKITDTSITTQGVTGILKGVPQENWNLPTDVRMKLDLTNFKTTFTAVQVSLVCESFYNLVSLEIFLTEQCNLAPLASLNCLRNLGLCRYRFPNIPDFDFVYAQDLLRDIGHQLHRLKIVNLNGTDLRFIIETCPSLQMLVLQFPDSLRLGFPEGMSVQNYTERFPLPELPVMQCLDMKLTNCNLIEYILAKTRNIQQLRLWSLFICSESLLNCLVMRMCDKSIQELEVKEDKIRIRGRHAILTTVNGCNAITDVCNLREMIWKVFEDVTLSNLAKCMKITKNYYTYS